MSEVTITLADRIRAALTSELSSADVSAVIEASSTEVGRLTARAAAAERATLDPLASAEEVTEARKTAADIAFELKRLTVAQERLGQRLKEVQATEKATRNADLYDAALKERDQLVSDLVKVYPVAAAQIADLLSRIEKSDAAIHAANAVLPAGKQYLFSADTVARGFPTTGIHERLARVVRLPNFAATDWQTLLWGPRR